MPIDDELESAAAFDDSLRNSSQAPLPTPTNLNPNHAQLMRLLHEVYRADSPLEESPSSGGAEVPTRHPTQVGRFRIQRLLGCGGFGAVYLADDPLLQRRVALKLIHSHVLSNPLNRQRVHREREVMARLQHTNVIPVWESGEEGDSLFIVSQYCSGPSLAQWLENHPEPLDAHHAATWLWKIADAVAHSHQRGVLHRDLKPSNILLEPPPLRATPQLNTDTGPTAATVKDSDNRELDYEQWQPRLSDFGLAKFLQPQPGSSSSGETQAGLFVGSIDYASPEQVRGQNEAIGPESDVFALGVLLYQLLTGRLPHEDASQYDVARQICDIDAVFPSEFREHIPRDLQAITLRALARQASDRYRSAENFRNDLYRFLNGQSVSARPLPLWERGMRWAKKYPTVAGLSSLCCLLAVSFLFYLESSNRILQSQSRELSQALVESNRQQGVIEKERKRAADSEQSLSQLNSLASKQLAYNHWQRFDFISTQEVLAGLDEAEATSIDWQWLQGCMSDTYRRYNVRDNPVLGLALDPSTGTLMSISESGKLRWWDLKRFEPIKDTQLDAGANTLAVAPDGKRVAVPGGVTLGLQGNLVELWKLPEGVRDGEPLHSHTTRIESLEFSPDGKWLASGPRYFPVYFTNMETKEKFAVKAKRRNRQIAFSPTSDRAAVLAESSKIVILQLETQQTNVTINWDNRTVYSFAWLPDQELIVASISGQGIQLRSTLDGSKLADVSIGMTAESIAVSHDGKTLALGSENGSIQLIDLDVLKTSDSNRNLKVMPLVRVLDGSVTDIVFTSNAQLAAADEEGSVICLNIQPQLRAAQSPKKWRTVRWLDDHQLVVLGHQAADLFEVNGHSAKLISSVSLAPYESSASVSCQSQDASLAAWATCDGKVTVVDEATKTILCTTTVNPGNSQRDGALALRQLLFSTDNAWLYATGANNRVSALRVADGSLAWEKVLTNSGYYLAEDPARHRIFVGGAFEAVKVFDSRTGQLQKEITGGCNSYSLLVDRAGNRLITGHSDGTVRVHDLELNQPAKIFRSNLKGINQLLLAADGKTIITGDNAGQLNVWSTEAGSFGVLYQSALAEAGVSDMAWSPDRSTVASVVFSAKGICELLLLPTK